MSSMRWRSFTTWSARPASTSQGTLLQTTGFNRPGFPGMGCWVSYGLGSMNENLPTFVVLPDHRGLASNGTKNWDSAFLPAQHQGTVDLPRHEDAHRGPVPGRAGEVHHPRRRQGRASTCSRNSTASTPRRGPATSGWTRASRATNWPRRCNSPRRGARPLEGTGARPQALRPRPRASARSTRRSTRRGDRLLRAEVPRRPAAARTRRAVRADLERQRQRLPAPQLGLATRT